MINKNSYKQRRRERKELSEHNYVPTLKKSNVMNKKTSILLKLLYEGKIETRDLPSSSGFDTINNYFRNHKLDKNLKQEFYNLLLCLSKKKSEKLLRDKNYVNAIFYIAKLSDIWINDVKKWTPKSHNIEKQFSELLRYIFTKYPVPIFMNSAWYDESEKYIKWFLYIFRFHHTMHYS